MPRATTRTVSWSSELLFNSILDRELGVPSVPSVFALCAGPGWPSPSYFTPRNETQGLGAVNLLTPIF